MQGKLKNKMYYHHFNYLPGGLQENLGLQLSV